MRNHTSSDASRNLVRWQFRRVNRLLTIGVTRDPNDAYLVVTLPHWNLGRGVVEAFDRPVAALGRHAAIAASLRESGWRVASYTS